jgi:hypothetical protein
MAVLAACLAAFSANAQSEKKPQPTPEQKQFRKEMIKKYDTNGDGKLDKEERAKMSQEDKQKMREMQGGQAKKPKQKKPDADE